MLTLWNDYKRADIPKHFGETFNPGKWNAGVVPTDAGLILLVTLTNGTYENRFIDENTFAWQSQNSTKIESKRGLQLADNSAPKRLFVRPSKRESFVYMGAVDMVSASGEMPISIKWRLADSLPQEKHETFKV